MSASPTSSSSGSICSRRNQLTPEAGSSMDKYPGSVLPNNGARLAQGHSPPLPLKQSRNRSASLENSAAEDPTATNSQKRSKDSLDDLNLQHGNRCFGEYAPRPKQHSCDSWPGLVPGNACRDSRPGDDTREPRLALPIADRLDFPMQKNQSKPSMSDSIERRIADPRSKLIPQHTLHLHGRNRYPGIPLQPEFSPISQEQLTTEMKGIYAGLVMVEAKCIDIDAQKAAQPDEPLSIEQWQALVALHRTLLYEHHDFFMATQHPAANPALLALATKYSMPARMWKHGIHAFLEMLRHRRPDSQEYMLAFIYLAYQMISLLLETVPGFTDTWIECLGDLARYRMAIEEDSAIHTIWGGVAGRWYVLAADRHPSVGRLYHHSGILKRPSLSKFYLYSRAVTSVVPFLNARESLRTLCSLILNDEQGSRGGSQSAEAMIMCFHARVFAGRELELTKRDGSTALALLEEQPSSKIANYGVALAITNVAALFGFGTPENIYRQLYDSILSKDILEARPSQNHNRASHTALTLILLNLEKYQHPQDSVYHFCYYSFNSIVQRTPSKESLIDLLPYLHIMLVFLNSTDHLQSRLTCADEARITLDGLLDSSDLDWSAFSDFLNLIAGSYPITSRTEQYATDETFPQDGVPLSEDFMIRGLVWTQWYFASYWFANIEDDDGLRFLEDDNKRRHRAARVLYLGIVLAKRSNVLSYDGETKRFSSVAVMDADDTMFATKSPLSVSAHSDVDSSLESDYVLVPRFPPRP